jgi:lysylphosphatidylglycerol synthetase-like protein (DUF2156 family)
MFRYILVLNRHRFINMRALNPFRRHRRRRNRRPAPKRLEARIHDVALVIHLDLQLHHVPARRGANHARAHVQIALIKTTHISRVLVVINNLRGARPSTNVSQPAHPSITGARAHPSTWRARSHGRTFLSYARLVTAFHNVAAVAVAVVVVVVVVVVEIAVIRRNILVVVVVVVVAHRRRRRRALSSSQPPTVGGVFTYKIAVGRTDTPLEAPRKRVRRVVGYLRVPRADDDGARRARTRRRTNTTWRHRRCTG